MRSAGWKRVGVLVAVLWAIIGPIWVISPFAVDMKIHETSPMWRFLAITDGPFRDIGSASDLDAVFYWLLAYALEIATPIAVLATFGFLLFRILRWVSDGFRVVDRASDRSHLVDSIASSGGIGDNVRRATSAPRRYGRLALRTVGVVISVIGRRRAGPVAADDDPQGCTGEKAGTRPHLGR